MRSLVMSAARAGVKAVATSSEPTKAPVNVLVFMLSSLFAPQRQPRQICEQVCVYVRYRLNTNSMEAVEVFFSSGENGMKFCDCREPPRTATYCLPVTG